MNQPNYKVKANKPPFKMFFLILFLQVTVIFGTGCSSFSSGRQYDVVETRLSEADFHVEIVKYGTATPVARSLLILPPTGGETFLDRSYARTFAEAGYDVYIIKQWTGLDERSSDLEIHQRLYTRAQKAIEIVLAQISSPYIGLLGTSVGALHGAVAASKQSRLNSVFIITGGAPITEVIATSDQKAMQKLREERRNRFGFKTIEENRVAIAERFFLEPMQLGDGYRKKALGMVITEQDGTVPSANQEKLKNYWQPQKVITYSNGHFLGIIKAWMFNKDDIFDFFQANAK